MKKIISIVKKLGALIQNNSKVSALVITVLVVIPLAVIGNINLPDKSELNSVFTPLVTTLGVGGLLWFIIAMLLEKKV